MPTTLTEKAIAQPFRVGLMLGALIVPILWVVSQNAMHLALGTPLLNSENVTQLFATGFVPGMILGAGTVRAWALWKAHQQGRVRRLLLAHSLLAMVGCWLLAPTLFGSHSDLMARPPDDWRVSFTRVIEYAFVFYDVFPLQCALAMLLCGLFMRGSRT